MSSRRAFTTSQKRRLGEEPSELEPSSSRMHPSSPPTTSSPCPSNLTGTVETEFDERVSEVSDNEYEELDSENDYQEEEDYEGHELEDDKKPKYALVELAQIEKLLQRCMLCGKLPSGPGGRLSQNSRKVTWTQNGTNVTATIRCACNNSVTQRWAGQEFLPETRTRSGNIALTAAAQVGPVSFPDLSAMFRSAKIACFSKSNFQKISKYYVYPCIEEEYYKQQSDLLREIPDPANIALDGQYDSPGFSAEMAAITAIEQTTKQVVNISVVCYNKH
uniref:Uncharacterized protein n=1 Tax=Acrobeloides nanus TaxID=290746 RepID=A0A914DA78_9BILA